jgi:hypothetical protein
MVKLLIKMAEFQIVIDASCHPARVDSVQINGIMPDGGSAQAYWLDPATGEAKTVFFHDHCGCESMLLTPITVPPGELTNMHIGELIAATGIDNIQTLATQYGYQQILQGQSLKFILT